MSSNHIIIGSADEFVNHIYDAIGLGDANAILSHGCYCSNLGGLHQDVTTPTDDRDKLCKNRRTCSNCASPSGCYPYNYDMSIASMCIDPIGTCERNQCECDKTMLDNIFTLVLTGAGNMNDDPCNPSSAGGGGGSNGDGGTVEWNCCGTLPYFLMYKDPPHECIILPNGNPRIFDVHGNVVSEIV